MNRLGCVARIGGGTPRTAPKAVGAALAVSVVLLSGCTGPTYGTGTPAEQQLVQDLTGALSLGRKERRVINYAPRPGIVKPPSTEVLPPPQQDVASTENPAWPESPEQRLARVRAEATANQNNRSYRPNVIHDVNDDPKPQALSVNSMTREEQRREFLRRQQIARQGEPTTRRYLSDPPIEYRQPAATAPAGELGEDEAKKERAAKAAAGGGTGGLRKLLPWLN